MAATKIIVRTDGPLRIEGDFEIVDMQGQVYGLAGRKTIGLCRCGQSSNKPFCDGAHNGACFKDEQHARDLPAPAPKPQL